LQGYIPAGAFTAVSDGQINVPIDPNSTVVKAARDALNGWDPPMDAYTIGIRQLQPANGYGAER